MQIYLIAGVLLLTIFGSAAYYYTSTQNTIEKLNKENALMSDAIKTNNATIEKLNKDKIEQRLLNTELSKALIESEKGADELRRLLSKHNLTSLVKAKPNLIEDRMNDGTKKVFDKLRDITTVD